MPGDIGSYLERFSIYRYHKRLSIPIIIVARIGLGTINHTLIVVRCARSAGIEIIGIIFNHTNNIKDGIAEKTNPNIIKRLCNIPILGIIPFIDKLKTEKIEADDLCAIFSENVDIKYIRSFCLSKNLGNGTYEGIYIRWEAPYLLLNLYIKQLTGILFFKNPSNKLYRIYIEKGR